MYIVLYVHVNYDDNDYFYKCLYKLNITLHFFRTILNNMQYRTSICIASTDIRVSECNILLNIVHSIL